jgi:hypothetical protein
MQPSKGLHNQVVKSLYPTAQVVAKTKWPISNPSVKNVKLLFQPSSPLPIETSWYKIIRIQEIKISHLGTFKVQDYSRNAVIYNLTLNQYFFDEEKCSFNSK